MKAWLLCGLMGAAVLGTCSTYGQEAGGGGGRGPMIIRPTPPAPPGWFYRYVGPVYQTVSEQVWVGDRVQMVAEWVEIVPGRLEQVWRQVVVPGHWELTTRRVLVSEGHYELVQISPPPIYIGPPVYVSPPVVRNPGTVGVEGYGMVQTEDLSKFSGLREWPASGK